jgi:hypothetical protein
MSETTKERHIRSAKEKAQDALDLATRKSEGAEKRVTRLKAELARAEEQYRDAEADKAHAASHPLLKQEEADLFDGPGPSDDQDDEG